MTTIILLLLSILPSLGAHHSERVNTLPLVEHPFYVSITELNIAQDTLQVSLRVFTDDLEEALQKVHDQKIFLNAPEKYEKHFVLIRDYLFDRVQAGGGAGLKRLNWLGYELDEDVCWIYGEMPLDDTQRVLFFRNAVLYELYNDQQNLIHLKTEDGYDTELATIKAPEVRFTPFD